MIKMSEVEMKYEAAVEKLKNFDTRKYSSKNFEAGNLTVAMKVKGAPWHKQGSSLKDIQCFNCQEFGHYKTECTKPWKARAKQVGATGEDFLLGSKIYIYIKKKK
jgi:hypothetical protein